MRIALKDIRICLVKNSQVGYELPTSVNDRVKSQFREGFCSRSFAKIKPLQKFPNLQYILSCEVLLILNPFSRIDLPTLISSNFRGVGWYFSFYFSQNFDRKLCKQTVKILFRHRIVRCLIGICTICLCIIKRALG